MLNNVQDHDFVDSILVNIWVRRSNAHQILDLNFKTANDKTTKWRAVGKSSEAATSHIGGKSTTNNVASRAEIEEDESICWSTSTRERKMIQNQQTNISFQQQQWYLPTGHISRTVVAKMG